MNKTVASLCAAKMVNLFKWPQNGGVEGGLYDHWLQDGHPGAGNIAPTAPGESLDASSPGAPFLPTLTGDQRYVGKFSIQQPLTAGIAYLYDRKYHVQVDENVAGEQAINSGPIARGPAKELFFSMATPVSATVEPVATVKYKNQDGVTRTVAGIAFNSSTRIRLQMTRIPLMEGDEVAEVVSCEFTTLTAHGAGTVTIVAMDPIAEVPYPIGGGDEDVFTIGMPAIDEDAAIQLVHQHSSGSTAGIFYVSLCVMEEQADGPTEADLLKALAQSTYSYAYYKSNAGSGTNGTTAGGRLKAGRPGQNTQTQPAIAGEDYDDTRYWAQPVPTPGAGKKLYLSKFHGFANQGPLSILIYDDLAGYRAPDFGVALQTVDNTGAAEPARLNDYPYDVEMWLDVFVAGGNTSGTFTYTYVNQDGVDKTMSVVLPANAISQGGRQWPLPLAPGDKGVRYVKQSVAYATGAVTGRTAITLRRRLADINIANLQMAEEDAIGTGMPEIDPAACIEYLHLMGTTGAVTVESHYNLTEL